MNAHADLRDAAKSAVLALAQGNRYFMSEGGMPDLTSGQAPEIILYMCSDSRIQMHSIAPVTTDYDPTNRVFTIENAGNRLDHPMLSGSGTYAADHIPSASLLFILGHSGCGAVDGSQMGDFSRERRDLAPYLEQMSFYLKANFAGSKTAVGQDVFQNNPAARTALSELNVDFQVATALDLYSDLVEAGKLTIIGGMLDIHKHYEATEGHGGLIITNFNGNTVPGKIQGSLEQSLDYTVERLTQGIPVSEIKLMKYNMSHELR